MIIIYENEQVIVCRKEAGEPVQTASLRVKDMVSRLKLYLREQNPEAGQPYLGIIHRLDQPVQGLVVFAKNPAAAADLSAQVQNGQMEKWYYAKVHPNADMLKTGKLKDWIRKNPKTGTSEVTRAREKGAKEAELQYTFVTDTVVRICLKTGRHHQIRVQFAHAGAPLYGDRRYGQADDLPFPCLCAYHLSFLMPGTGERTVFEIPAEEIPWF